MKTKATVYNNGYLEELLKDKHVWYMKTNDGQPEKIKPSYARAWLINNFPNGESLFRNKRLNTKLKEIAKELYETDFLSIYHDGKGTVAEIKTYSNGNNNDYETVLDTHWIQVIKLMLELDMDKTDRIKYRNTELPYDVVVPDSFNRKI